ncbi:VOC family protein [Bacillus sp. V2I10]|uniref:SMU1112c/YaeR family gloxylase I-like metalloprotein n=1 Tax=Bacillus sp. V2I10 TaxID=3042276 RepID=UPI00277D7164|nr:VOC family protein [Bacillus sp. V2I10]MDQ0857045.1 glyoxylase I family protein [Bacillus sp. V2I10]
MKIRKVHHVAVICTDYALSKDFYVNKLGFEIIHKFYRAERDSYKLDLAVGDHTQIELFSFPSPPERPSRSEAAGLRHLAFSIENIHETVSHLNELGIETEPIRVDPFTKRLFTFFQDPDGLPLELYEDPVETVSHNS